MNNLRTLRTPLTVSLFVHAALFGLLVSWASEPLRADRPLRVRIIARQESPAPPAEARRAPAPARPAPAPRAEPPRMPEARRAEEPRGPAQPGTTPGAGLDPPRVATPPAPPSLPEAGEARRDTADAPARSGPDATVTAPRPPADPGNSLTARAPVVEAAPVPPAPPPLAVEKRPLPAEEPVVRQPVPPLVEARPPVTPQPSPAARSPLPEAGLTLGGPAESRADVWSPRDRRPRSAEGPEGPAARRSLRDQIASLGSGMTTETGKQTVNLDSREPRFLSYLARVKRRIERTWTYPADARALGLGGDLLLIFTLNHAGTLTDIELLHSSGFPILDEEALRAVKAAAPFDPFPAELGDEPWNISASFHYTLPRARPR